VTHSLHTLFDVMSLITQPNQIMIGLIAVQ